MDRRLQDRPVHVRLSLRMVYHAVEMVRLDLPRRERRGVRVHLGLFLVDHPRLLAGHVRHAHVPLRHGDGGRVGLGGLRPGVPVGLLLAASLRLRGVALHPEVGPLSEVLAALAPLEEEAGGVVDPDGDVAVVAHALVLLGDVEFGRVAHWTG